MLKVVDIFPIGNMYSVTLEGPCEKIKNGSHLVDDGGNTVVVVSVAMTRHDTPSDINKSTNILVESCSFHKGSELSIS